MAGGGGFFYGGRVVLVVFSLAKMTINSYVIIYGQN
jgi:hypothetical protein